MAIIEDMNWWTSGPVGRKMTIKQRAALNTARAKREAYYRDIYADVVTAITSVVGVDLAEEVGGYVLIRTKQENLTVRVHHPKEIKAMDGSSFVWSIAYGDAGWDKVTYEDYPGDMSAADIAHRVDYLVNLVNFYPKALKVKHTRRMKDITTKLVKYIPIPA